MKQFIFLALVGLSFVQDLLFESFSCSILMMILNNCHDKVSLMKTIIILMQMQ